MTDVRGEWPRCGGIQGIGGWLILPVAIFALIALAAPVAIGVSLARSEPLWAADNANYAIMGLGSCALLYQIIRKREAGRYWSMLLCTVLAAMAALEISARAMNGISLNMVPELARIVSGTIGALYFAFSKRVRFTLVN